MRIVIVGLYYLIEGFYGGSDALKSAQYTVDFFPGLFYIQHKSNIFAEHLINFIKGNDCSYDDKLIYNKDNLVEASVVIWWGLEEINKNILNDIKEQTGCLQILINNYDPESWFSKKENIETVKIFDIIFTYCKKSQKYYQSIECNKVVHILPGYDPNIHKYIKDDKYKCDVGVIFDNYNSDPSFFELINKLINETSFSIKIYGNNNLKDTFPKNYVGEIKYDQTNLVFSNSKININFCSELGKSKLNERACQILGCNGLMMINQIDGLDELFKKKECVVVNKNNFVKQVTDILKNYKGYGSIRKNGLNKATKSLKWDNWAKTIKNELKCILGDEQPIVQKNGLMYYEDHVSEERKKYEIIFLLKALAKSTCQNLYFNDLCYIINKSDIDVNQMINKYFEEIVNF